MLESRRTKPAGTHLSTPRAQGRAAGSVAATWLSPGIADQETNKCGGVASESGLKADDVTLRAGVFCRYGEFQAQGRAHAGNCLKARLTGGSTDYRLL